MIKKMIMMTIAAAVLTGTSAFAAEAVYDVEVTNNVGKKDSVVISGVEPKAAVSVYSSKGVLLGKKTAGNSATEVTLTVNLPSVEGNDSVKVSILEKSEEAATQVVSAYDAEPVSESPLDNDVEITNNVDKKATIYIQNLDPKDTVYVYNSSTGKKIASGKVGNNKDELTISCKQLGAAAGTLSITVKSVNKLESPRKDYSYAAQETTELLNDNKIEITNNVGKKGTVVMEDLDAGTLVMVYSADASGKTLKKLGSSKATATKDYVSISVKLDPNGGYINITVKEANKLASEELTVQYDAQPTTPELTAGDIEITSNPTGVKDTIYIEGLEGGDTIKVYKDEKTTATLLKGSVGSTAEAITLSKLALGAVYDADAKASYVYISNTRKGMLEGKRLKVLVPDVSTSTAVDKDNVTITNNAGSSDSIYITGLAEGAVVTVYSKAKNGTKLGSATVSGETATITVSQLGKTGGTVWIGRKDSGENESVLTELTFSAEQATIFPFSEAGTKTYNEITIVNNAGMADSVTVTRLKDGDTIKIYATDKSTSALATATCGTYASSVTLSPSQLGVSGGSAYITFTQSGYLESARVEVMVAPEGGSDAIDTEKASVTNNTGIASTITVSGLNSGDVVTVYSSATSTASIGSGTVAAYNNSVTFNISSSLKSDNGSVWVTRKSSGFAESVRVEVEYGGVDSTDEVETGDVNVQNNSGASDTIKVTGLNTGDVVNVYKTASITTVWGKATADSSGSATITISQLGTAADSVYISVTASGKTESKRVKVDYLGESAAPVKDSISVVNNVTIESVVTVSRLTSGDVVKVYSSSTASSPIGTATASGDSVTISVGQLTASAGKVYVSVTNYGRCESSRTAQDYDKQQTTTVPTNVTITNRKDAGASVTVNGLEAGDSIKVFSDAAGASFLGSATATGSTLTFEISKLGDSSGTVYISRTSVGKNESSKTAFQYAAAN